MTDMIRPHCVDSIDFIIKCCRLVNDELKEVVRRGLSSEELELVVYSQTPGDDYSGCDLTGRTAVKRCVTSTGGVYAR